MTIEKPLKSMIVGCGSIGALKPDKFDRPHGQNILTHAHAYRVSPDIQLQGVVDMDEEKAALAAKKWGVLQNTDMAQAMQDWKPDIVSVCVPTENHYEVLIKILKQTHKPRLVIVEKPFCNNLKEANRIKKLYEQTGIPILINYTRRFSLEYLFLQQKIMCGDLGKIYHARLLYGRGLSRDGCHGLDIFNWFLGKITGILVTEVMFDYLITDPSISMRLSYEKCADVQLVAVDSRKYGIFEMEIIAEKEIVKLTENGLWMHTYVPVLESVYGNYKSMPNTPHEGKKTDLTNTLSRMVANAAGHLLNGDALLCTDKDALLVQETIHAVGQVNMLTEKEKKKRCLH